MQCVEIYTLVIHVVPGSVSASTVTAGCCCCRRRRLPRAPEPIHHVEPSVAISALAYSVLCSAPVRFVSLSFHYFLSLLLSVILSFIRICFCFPLPYTPPTPPHPSNNNQHYGVLCSCTFQRSVREYVSTSEFSVLFDWKNPGCLFIVFVLLEGHIIVIDFYEIG